MLLSKNDPFSVKAWGEFLNQNLFLAEHGLSAKDVEKKFAELRKEDEKIAILKAEMDKQAAKWPKCPECEAPIQLLSVNDSPSTQTGDDSKSVWLCRNCHYEKFSDKSIQEELELLKESENGNKQI